MAALRIDAHQHFWKVARGDYGWLTPELAPLYRDFGPEDLAPLLAARGIDGTILVQAAPTLAETEYLLELAERTPFVLGVVGWVDFEAPDAPDVLARFAEREKFVGVRPMIQDLADDAWMLRRELEPAFRAVSELDLTFDALVKPRHLAHLSRLVERHPDLRVVIDHAAKPAIAEGARHWRGFARWREDLARLSESPQVFVKLSGLPTEALRAAGNGTLLDWHVDDLAPFVDVLFERFLPERVLWGSDWPVVEAAGGYARWGDAARTLVDARVRDELLRARIFGASALDSYRIRSRAPRARGPLA
ncbi:MAG: amidohydrolase family protein [Planctomycetes bacterium]|nr:amidohydrolase family protein [Planctomycetota bacterium]